MCFQDTSVHELSSYLDKKNKADLDRKRNSNSNSPQSRFNFFVFCSDWFPSDESVAMTIHYSLKMSIWQRSIIKYQRCSGVAMQAFTDWPHVHIIVFINMPHIRSDTFVVLCTDNRNCSHLLTFRDILSGVIPDFSSNWQHVFLIGTNQLTRQLKEEESQNQKLVDEKRVSIRG